MQGADKMRGEESTQRNSKARRFVEVLQSTSYVPFNDLLSPSVLNAHSKS